MYRAILALGDRSTKFGFNHDTNTGIGNVREGVTNSGEFKL